MSTPPLDDPERPALEKKSRGSPPIGTGPGSFDDDHRVDESWQEVDHTRHWVFATGAVSLVTIALAAFVILGILTRARGDLERVSSDGLSVQQQVVDLRTNVFDFQAFIETNLDRLTPGRAPTASELAQGAVIVQTIIDGEASLARSLRRIGLAPDAEKLDTALTQFNDANTRLTPIAAGEVVSTATQTRIVAAERASITNLWTVTTDLDDNLSKNVTGADVRNSLDHLRTARPRSWSRLPTTFSWSSRRD